MPKPRVIQVIDDQRARLQAHEADIMREMAQRWLKVEDALKADMLDLSLYLDELRLRGETISAARLMQMDRYRQMIADARREHEQYSRWLADSLAADQRGQVAQGITDAQKLIEAAGEDARIAHLVFDRINVSAVEFMVGFASDGTPLYDLLRASYPESVVKLTDALIQGLAKGVGPRATAAAMAENMAGNLDRALLIARTEQLRALRAGNQAQFQQSNVVSGYIRRAQRNATVCPACLSLDGKIYPTDELFAQHPADQCYMQPVLRFGKTPSFPTGQEWLATQPESVQRQILGKGKFELYKDGKLDWSKVAVVHDNPIWGPTIRQGTMAEVELVIDNPIKIDFQSAEHQYVTDLGNIGRYYSHDDPGLEYVVPRPVYYNSFGSAHLTDDEHNYRLKWLAENQEWLIKAIHSPDFIEKELRERLDGHFSSTQIVELPAGLDGKKTYLSVAISLSKEPKSLESFHQITTIYPMKERALFSADGKLREKFRRIK
jgi:SPP1 gp7 family putative phage head morphogenesis protein